MKRKFIPLILALIIGVLGISKVDAADVVPNEIVQPGTQKEDNVKLELSSRCDNCHGGYDQAVEPAYNWMGSMMTNASRDPIFWATLAIAEQDFDGSGDLCLRCHSTSGWYDDNSTPTDGSALTSFDANGVECDFCHKLTNPNNSEHLGLMVAPFFANDGLTPATGYYGSGIASIWDGSEKLGPYAEGDADPDHQFFQSEYHRDISFCGTCHDVSNPAVGDLAHNNGAQDTADPVIASGVLGSDITEKAAFNNFPYQYGIVERTFSEYYAGELSKILVKDILTLPTDLQDGAILNAFLTSGGDYQDGSERYFSCQTCHMQAVTGHGCNKSGVPLRDDLPLHDLTGGNYWIQDVILYQDNLDTLLLGGGLKTNQIAAIQEGQLRAQNQLEMAASLSVEGNTLKVTNLTGHKLISGYPEGRRMWLNIKWYDSGNVLLREDGEYGQVTSVDGTPVNSIIDLNDPNTKIYEIHMGMTQEWANQLLGLGYSPSLALTYDRVTGAVTSTLGDLASEPTGTSYSTFHFVLNNTVVIDDRIPPYGMTYSGARQRNTLPVPASQYGNPSGDETFDYWDEVTLNPPTNAVYAEIQLLYQPTSWEYIQFLNEANTGEIDFLANEGANLLDAWMNTGMAEPYVMTSTTWGATSNPPEAFNKIEPGNGAINQPINLPLDWQNSTGAESYQYCIDTSNDDACSSWVSTDTTSSVNLSGLSYNTTYFWQVRAINGEGTTYANDGYWQFNTRLEPIPPGAFSKSSPGDTTTSVSLDPTLEWGTSTGATSYEYCYDTTGDQACSNWIDVGTNLSVSLSGLEYQTTYYWQVRANNTDGTTYANGDDTSEWSFTTRLAPPEAFSKISPGDTASSVSINPTLDWDPSNGASSYEYCYDTSNDHTCSTWHNTGSSTMVSLSSLTYSTTYYWQVRAINQDSTTYANGAESNDWSFTTRAAPIYPGPFSKTNPSNGSTGVEFNLTLYWETSTYTTEYEYCYDTTNDNVCSSWISTGTTSSVNLSSLSSETTYYWQVRAKNTDGYTYANGSATDFWNFTTKAAAVAPGAFDKVSPTDGFVSESDSFQLEWQPSEGVETYEYCFDTIDDDNCLSWIDNSANETVTLNNLDFGSTYYWQVRAKNTTDTTYANDSETSYWQFMVQYQMIYLPLLAR
jgi:hypothetical protein